MTVTANTRYNFSGWTKASNNNPGCSVTFFIGNAADTGILKTLGTVASTATKTTWVESTGFYDSGSATQVTFNVRWTCTGSNARTYYVDDLSLIAAA